jgi:hypothetical protein
MNRKRLIVYRLWSYLHTALIRSSATAGSIELPSDFMRSIRPDSPSSIPTGSGSPASCSLAYAGHFRIDGELWFALAVVVGHNPDAPPNVVADLNTNIERPDGIAFTFERTTRPLNVLKPSSRHVLK